MSRSLHPMHILAFAAACVLVAELFGLKIPQSETGIPQDEAVIRTFSGMSGVSAAAILGDQLTLEPEGTPCTTLGEALLRLPVFHQDGFDQTVGSKGNNDKRLSPTRNIINIEALCDAPDGKTLYLGLCSPHPEGKAVVVPLLNASAVIDKQEIPAFGAPLFWDLQGLGLRSLEYSPHHGRCFALAGFHDGRDGGVLYEWSGNPADPPQLIGPILPDVPDFTSEALVIFTGPEGLWFFSDDGSRLIDIASPAECLPGKSRDGHCENKYLTDFNKKTFRGAKLMPQWPKS